MDGLLADGHEMPVLYEWRRGCWLGLLSATAISAMIGEKFGDEMRLSHNPGDASTATCKVRVTRKHWFSVGETPEKSAALAAWQHLWPGKPVPWWLVSLDRVARLGDVVWHQETMVLCNFIGGDPVEELVSRDDRCAVDWLRWVHDFRHGFPPTDLHSYGKAVVQAMGDVARIAVERENAQGQLREAVIDHLAATRYAARPSPTRERLARLAGVRGQEG